MNSNGGSSPEDGPQEEQQTFVVNAARGNRCNKLNRVTFSAEVDKEQNEKARHRLKCDDEKKVSSSRSLCLL